MSEEIRMWGFLGSMAAMVVMLFLLWLLEWRYDRATWHRWWAWHPVKADRKTVWFGWVERNFCSPAGYGCSWWEYRLPESPEQRFDRLRAKYPKPKKGPYNAPGNF